MYLHREISTSVLRLAEQYPIVTITGPRQSGKTTLARKLFPERDYVSLEDIDNRQFALNDPRGFLTKYPGNVIIDEVQRVPDLLSYIQTFVDSREEKGLFILTGSRQFELMDAVTQSLAGRTALVHLLPFSYNEAYSNKGGASISETLYRGFYPRIIAEKLNPTEAYSFYVNTYIERDVRQIINVQELSLFEVFLKLCAGRTGQIINYSELAGSCGIDHKTVKRWLSILETSYIVKILRPYYRNLNKRLIKSPKLYFCDPGLAAYLLNIRKPSQLENHPLIGALFETYAVGELFKSFYNKIRKDNLYFFRDSRAREVDILFDKVVSVDLLEIKIAQTIHSSMFRQMHYVHTLPIKVERMFLVYGGEECYSRENTQIISWNKIADILEP